MINTILASALAGAAGGALGGAIVWGVQRLRGGETKPSKWASLVAVGLAVACGRLGSAAAERYNMESGLLAFGPFKALHDFYPVDYAEMIRVVRETDARNGGAIDYQNAARPVFMRAFQRQLPMASDALLVGMLRVNADEAEALKEKNPEQCVALMAPKGDTVPFPVGELVPKPLLEKEAQLETAILRETAGRTPPAKPAPVSDEKLGALTQAALAPIPEAEHAKLIEMAQGRAPANKAEATSYCSFLIGLMRAMVAMEPAGPTVRSVMFGG